MTFTGTIYSDVTGKPLAGAQVYAYDPGSGLQYGQPAVTDAAGKWTLDLPADTYLVYLYADGHRSFSDRVKWFDGVRTWLKAGSGVMPEPGGLIPVIIGPRPKMNWAWIAAGVFVLNHAIEKKWIKL